MRSGCGLSFALHGSQDVSGGIFEELFPDNEEIYGEL